LQGRYEEWVAARRVVLTAEAADAHLTFDFAAPPAVVWEWLNDPAKRTRWQSGSHWRAGLRPNGRTGPGASNHCDHGSGRATETVLDWRPFEYVTLEVKQGRNTLVHTAQLQPLADGTGTRLDSYFQFHLPLPRRMVRWVGGSLLSWLKLERNYEKMAALMMAEEGRLGMAGGRS
jgi:uncharacterized protein YndB with AHSA1/START domain